MLFRSGFGGCTINLVKKDLSEKFIETAKTKFNEKYGHEPKVYPVVISDGAHKIESAVKEAENDE